MDEADIAAARQAVVDWLSRPRDTAAPDAAAARAKPGGAVASFTGGGPGARAESIRFGTERAADGPRRGRPWLNAGAGGDPFYVGGLLCEADGAALVRVRFSDGLVMEDAAGPDGIVLVPSGRGPAPDWIVDSGATVELPQRRIAAGVAPHVRARRSAAVTQRR
jgi:hypothetical protein